ncbi:DUF4179 domain-containing protein [Paenibacillus popilliae]|nr:DUF4179 domain-containing protein [Paenibacillus sp. SDF0028]
MAKWSNRTKLTDQEINQLEQIIHDTEMPVYTYSHRIMNRIREEKATKKKSIWKPAVIATSLAVVISGGVIGSGFVSSTMAHALSKLPFIGVVFQQTGDYGLSYAVDNNLVAEINQSITHDGVTLRIKNMVYDGIRLAFTWEREGEDVSSYLFSPSLTDDRGVVRRIRFFDESRDDLTYGLGLSMYQLPDDPNSGISVSWERAPILYTGKFESESKPLPDEFNLLMNVSLSGVREVFMFNIPVKKNTKNINFTPCVWKSYDGLSLSLEKMELTPITTRVKLKGIGDMHNAPDKFREPTKVQELPGGPIKILGLNDDLLLSADVFDEQGNKAIGLDNAGLGGFAHKYEDTNDYGLDLMFEPYRHKPKSITVKPFLYDYESLKAGKVEKHYVKELEFTVELEKE